LVTPFVAAPPAAASVFHGNGVRVVRQQGGAVVPVRVAPVASLASQDPNAHEQSDYEECTEHDESLTRAGCQPGERDAVVIVSQS
jgi:hypothetical protein